jgi:hypothetical protein
MMFGLYSAVPEVATDETSLVVYPSPATDFIHLKNAPAGELNITVYTLTGAMLMNNKLTDNSQQIDIRPLAKGIYLLRVNTEILKFAKQ